MNGPVVCICGRVLDPGPILPEDAEVLREAHEALSPSCAEAFGRLLGEVLGRGEPQP